MTSLAVGKSMEHVEDDPASVRADLEQESAVEFVSVRGQRIELTDCGELVKFLEIPPESAALESATEAGDSFDCIIKGLLEVVDVHGFVEGYALPEKGSVPLGKRGRVNVRRVVESHCNCCHCFAFRFYGCKGIAQERLAKEIVTCRRGM